MFFVRPLSVENNDPQNTPQTAKADDNPLKRFTANCAQVLQEFHFRKFTLGSKVPPLTALSSCLLVVQVFLSFLVSSVVSA